MSPRASHVLNTSFAVLDSDDPRPWSLTIQLPATFIHVVAILATISRLVYRWHLARFSWDDAWATLALVCDVGCLVAIWMQIPPDARNPVSQKDIESGWLLSLTLTCIVWFSRMSILSSIDRIAKPEPKSRLTTFCIGAMFLVMATGLLAQKIIICATDSCRPGVSVAIAQLVTDVISDSILVIIPIRFLRDVKLHRDRRILIISTFSASLLITAVTILHSILLFQKATNATLIIGHIKATLSLFICNALVLVTFVYRLCRKSEFDLERSIAKASRADNVTAQFTSVIDFPSKISSVPEGTEHRGDVTSIEGPTTGTSRGSE